MADIQIDEMYDDEALFKAFVDATGYSVDRHTWTREDHIVVSSHGRGGNVTVTLTSHDLSQDVIDTILKNGRRSS